MKTSIYDITNLQDYLKLLNNLLTIMDPIINSHWNKKGIKRHSHGIPFQKVCTLKY